MSLPAALPQGTLIGGHYIIGTLMNSGGFGAVYRGVDTSEKNRPCAIKETYDVTPAARRRALMEAGVLFTVRSSHLPEVYDAFEFNGRFYLVMQLIEGQNLLQVLRARAGNVLVGAQPVVQRAQGPCSEQEVMRWSLPIIEVLQDLHSRKPPVLHRDIKPGNIILTPQQTTVLVDFGLTKLYDPNATTQTMTRAVTEGFSPVEQYLGQTCPQSDIYAMAATMYLLLTNRLPPSAMSRATRDTLIMPRQLNSSISPHVEQALIKALAVHSVDRYQSMHEFADALCEPAFSAYADRTEPVAPVQKSVLLSSPPAGQAAPATPAMHVAPTIQATPVSHIPAGPAGYSGYAGLPPTVVAQPPVAPHGNGQAQPGKPGGKNNKGQQQMHAPVPAQGVTPAGYGMAPAPIGVVKPLPGSFGQGCLWGLLQGVLSALLVLFMMQVEYFYLAIVMGFCFYVLAGFMTTRRGGSAWRGIWAGYWAGITSTILFWVVLGVGIVIRASQYISMEYPQATGGPPPKAFGEAMKLMTPEIPDVRLLQAQTPFVNVLAWLALGLLVALVCGLSGGMLGKRRWMQKMKQHSISP